MRDEIIIQELKKYLTHYVLSENSLPKREFALEMLLKLESFRTPQATSEIDIKMPEFPKV